MVPTGEMRHLGPYVVHDRLGSGGMGEVYKAYDDRLDRWVAIKRIRPDKEEASEHRDRLRREARAAARLNHPSIVHVYDIFDEQDSDCIVMELVEGTSLDQLIQQGPLDPERVAEIGRQIASGLAEAHEKGILHRDLKTENVIITEGDHPKILDFGLAKPLIQGDLDTKLTGKGQVVGTSRTMSPEYVSGDAVDHRSDLFSLGVLLYEAVTAKSPFKAHNTLATLKRVILHRQPPAREVNPAVPDALSDLIDCLLEKEPADRIQTAVEVADALGQLTGSSESGLGSTGSFPLLRPQAQRSKALWLLAAGVLAIIGLAFWLGRQGAVPPRGSVEQPLLLVLADLANSTGDDSLIGLNDALRLGLEQSDSLTLLSSSELRESLARMQADPESPIDRNLAVDIAQREGADAVVIARADRFGSSYSLGAEVIEPVEGRTVLVAKETAQGDNEVIPALDRVLESLVSQLSDLSREGVERKPLERVTTSSLDALKAYSRGIEMFERVQWERAIPLLEEAVALDPGFAMARAKLGTAYSNSGSDAESVIGQFEEALKFEDRLTLEESLYVRSWIATLKDRPSDALKAWGTMRELLPKNFNGHHNFALVSSTYFNDFDSAEQALEAAIETSQRRASFFYLGYSRLALGKWAGAEHAFSTARDLGLPQAVFGLSDIYMAQGRITESEAVLELLSPALSSSGIMLKEHQQRVETAFLRGDLENASALAQSAIQEAIKLEQFRSEQASRMILIMISSLLGNDTVVRNELMQGLDRTIAADSRSLPGGELSKSFLLSNLGKLAARHGLTDEARSFERALAMIEPDQPNHMWRAYAAILGTEVSVSRGDLAAASSQIADLADYHDCYSGRDTVAFVRQVSGDTTAAYEAYQWLQEHVGRAFAECLELCFDRPINIMTVATLRLNLAKAEMAIGEHEKAIETFSQVPHPWQELGNSRGLAPNLPSIDPN